MEKISIIVLTYNVGQYLQACVQSIQQQDYPNLEIILVDDGSIDDSVCVSEQLRRQDDRIKVVQEHNSGAGPARNIGVEVATGNYLMFVDGDDLLVPGMVTKLYQMIKNEQSEIACCLFYRQDEQGTYYFYNDKHNLAQEGVYTSQEWLLNETKPVIGQIFYQAWGKLYQRQLFQQIEYPHHSYGEDALTSWKLYLAADRIAYTNWPGYCWRMRKGSITRTKLLNMRSTKNNLLAVEQKLQFYPLLDHQVGFLYDRWQDYTQKQVIAAQQQGEMAPLHDAELRLKLFEKYHPET